MVVHALNSGRAHPKLVADTEKIFWLERQLEAQFRWVYIPTDANTQADLASRSNRVCSMPNTCLSRQAMHNTAIANITHVLCSDAAGLLAQYRAGPSLIDYYSVNKTWFDNPQTTAGGVIWLEPPVERARALCEAV